MKIVKSKRSFEQPNHDQPGDRDDLAAEEGNKKVVVLHSWWFGPADGMAEGVARASDARQSSMEHFRSN
jgi:hypothetical protein